MDNVIFSDMFSLYKSGFANGVVDFIVDPLLDVCFDNEFDENITVWDIGYYDAVKYFRSTLINSSSMTLDISNINTVIIEMFTQRIGLINKTYGYCLPAFALVLKPKMY